MKVQKIPENVLISFLVRDLRHRRSVKRSHGAVVKRIASSKSIVVSACGIVTIRPKAYRRRRDRNGNYGVAADIARRCPAAMHVISLPTFRPASGLYTAE